MRSLFLLAAICCLLSSCGGGARVGSVLPLGNRTPMVTFIFDDGNDTDYLIGKKVFKAQGAVACSAITTGFINTPDHLTPAQIIGLKDAGWEIMSHTVSHPNLKSLTPVEIDDELSRSKATLEGLGVTVNNIVYPFNRNDETVRAIASRYYRSGRGGTNELNSGEIDPYFLKSFTLKHDLPLMESHIDRAFIERSWLIFYYHEMDVKAKVSAKDGTFIKGETVRLTPSGTVARFTATHWFPVYGYHVYLVPLSGTPGPGDTITGEKSGATARIDRIIYDDQAQFTEMIGYIRKNYPEMRIVTVDQGLDLLGVPQWSKKMAKNPGKAAVQE